MARGPDPRPPLELLGTGEPEQDVQRIHVGSERSRRRNGLWLIAVVGIAVIAAVVFGDDAAEGPDREPADEGAAPEAGSLAGPPADASPTSVLVGGGAPVLGSPVGASLLLGSVDEGWRVLDLDSGTLRDVPGLAGVAAEAIVPVAGGVVVFDEILEPLELIELPDGTARELTPRLSDPPRLAGVTAVLSAGQPDRLWVIWSLMDPDAEHQLAVLTDREGRPVSNEIEVRATPLTGTAAGLVFSAGGRTYLNDDDVSLLVDGVARAASANEVAVLSCDERAACSPAVVDLESRRVREGPNIPGATYGTTWMSLSPGGRLLVIPDHRQPPTASSLGVPHTVFIVEPDGSSASGEIPSMRSVPAWLPGDSSAVALTTYGLVRLQVDDGRVVTDRVPGVRSGVDDTVIVIPDG